VVNKHYIRGRAFEYEMMALLKEHLPQKKYTVIRTAGSHSPVDVLVIKHMRGDNKAFGVQCKTKKASSKVTQ